MPVCPVCRAEESREGRLDEVFRIDGEYVLVGGIPAVVWAQCGQQAFGGEAVEKVRTMVRGGARATKSVSMQFFHFVS